MRMNNNIQLSALNAQVNQIMMKIRMTVSTHEKQSLRDDLRSIRAEIKEREKTQRRLEQ